MRHNVNCWISAQMGAEPAGHDIAPEQIILRAC